jgi:hypothetical protein
MTVLLLSLAGAMLSHLVLAQPLEAGQYAALMDVYEGLGPSFNALAVRWQMTFFFSFFFFCRMQSRVLPAIQFIIPLHGQ